MITNMRNMVERERGRIKFRWLSKMTSTPWWTSKKCLFFRASLMSFNQLYWWIFMKKIIRILLVVQSKWTTYLEDEGSMIFLFIMDPLLCIKLSIKIVNPDYICSMPEKIILHLFYAIWQCQYLCSTWSPFYFSRFFSF